MSKAFDTLVLLVENRDRVVTKDELLGAIWPDVAVEEGNLTQQIFLLRKALGDTAQQPRYIATVPGHGYRFTARVREISDGAAAVIAAPAGGGAGSHWPIRFGRPTRVGAGVLLLCGVATLGIVAAITWRRAENAPGWWDFAGIRTVKVTESGKAVNSAISPDGQFVAYVQNDGDEYSLWVTQVATGGLTQVVPARKEILRHATFSPDGKYVYYTRGAGNRGGFVLYRVPAIGGAEAPILDDVDTPISFSPDGRQFVFMRGAGPRTHIIVAEAASGSQRTLSSLNRPLRFAYVAPAWSPDGTLVAASVENQSESPRWSIVLLSSDGGGSREIYASADRIGRVLWLPDGSGLLAVISATLPREFAPWQAGFANFSGGSIWRIEYPRARATRLTPELADHDLCCLGITANGQTIAAVVNSMVSDLWIASADQLDKPRQITWGSPVMSRHSWLPDNETIVYRDLKGRLNAVRQDGRGFSLTLPENHLAAGGVSACGDGRHVVFQAVPGNDIWRVSPTAGGAVRLTKNHLDSNPACSPDGKWVMYSSLRQNVPTLWRVAIEGGDPAPLVPSESFDALPSPSGRMIYYAAFEWERRPVPVRHLRWIVMDANDRRRLFTVDRPAEATTGILPAWAPDESGLDYVVTRAGVSNIWRQPLAGGPAAQITHFIAGKIFSFAWSPDGQWLSMANGVNRSDVVLISRGRRSTSD
jgi:Tol biopolymer transport system component